MMLCDGTAMCPDCGEMLQRSWCGRFYMPCDCDGVEDPECVECYLPLEPVLTDDGRVCGFYPCTCEESEEWDWDGHEEEGGI